MFKFWHVFKWFIEKLFQFLVCMDLVLTQFVTCDSVQTCSFMIFILSFSLFLFFRKQTSLRGSKGRRNQFQFQKKGFIKGSDWIPDYQVLQSWWITDQHETGQVFILSMILVVICQRNFRKVLKCWKILPNFMFIVLNVK